MAWGQRHLINFSGIPGAYDKAPAFRIFFNHFDEIRDLIMNGGSTGVLREASIRGGMRTLRESGMLAMYDGITTLDEVGKETLAAEM